MAFMGGCGLGPYAAVSLTKLTGAPRSASAPSNIDLGMAWARPVLSDVWLVLRGGLLLPTGDEDEVGSSLNANVMEQGRLQRKPILCRSPNGLAVPRTNDVWVTGTHGELVHWNGITQTRGEYDPRGRLVSMIADDHGRAWSCLEDVVLEARPARSVSLWIQSNRSANRVAWNALSELCARIATRLDGYVLAL